MQFSRCETTNSKYFSSNLAFDVKVSCFTSRGMPYVQIIGVPPRETKAILARLSAVLGSLGIGFPRRKTIFSVEPALLMANQSRSLELAFLHCYLKCLQSNSDPISAEQWVWGGLDIDGNVVSAGIRSFDLNPKARYFVPWADSLLLRDENLENGSSGVKKVQDLVDLIGKKTERGIKNEKSTRSTPFAWTGIIEELDNIKGQGVAKRALFLAALSGQHIAFFGPDSSGITSLAQLLPLIREGLHREDSHLICQHSEEFVPYRCPWPSASRSQIFGGDSSLKQGELDLANNGILHLENYFEWPKSHLELLRLALDHGYLVKQNVRIPLKIQLVVTGPLCPCGMAGMDGEKCKCSAWDLKFFRKRNSSGLLERIALRTVMGSSQKVCNYSGRELIDLAMEGKKKLNLLKIASLNHEDSKALGNIVPWDPQARRLLEERHENSRYITGLMQTALAAAIMDQSPRIQKEHAFEALFLRQYVWR